MDLSKKVFGSNVDPKIRKYFDDLQRGGFDAELSPLSEFQTLDNQSYLGDRAPYARMWTVVEKVPVKSETDKDGKVEYTELRDNLEKIVHIINDNKVESYEEHKSRGGQSDVSPSAFGFGKSNLSTKSELRDNPLLKPTAGITEISSESQGSMGALRDTTVKFIVHNKVDLDNIFLPFFLKPASTVFLDFGWSDKAFELYDVKSILAFIESDFKGFYEKIYNRDENDIKKGLMTTVHGQVTKYDIKMTEQGSFDCTLTFVSSNYHLLDKEITKDNNLKFTFTNILEDLLLIKYLNRVIGGDNYVKDQLKDLESWSRVPQEQRREARRLAFDSKEILARHRTWIIKSTTGLIDANAREIGIFYQDLTSYDNYLQQKESLYMSLALFEDEFLNKFIAFNDENNRTPPESYSLPKFNSVNSYVRWDSDLFEMMKTLPKQSDKILSFLYPDTWNVGETSNKYKPNRDLYVNNAGENDYPGDKKITEYDIKRKRIPLRELFIRTSIIIEAFETASNLNDAFELMFDHIFEDSGNLINIRMIKNNDAETSLGFHDVNAQPKEMDDIDNTLMFDITSGNTVVQDIDLTFETPKSGLASMIAISSQSVPKIYEEFQLLRLNMLNNLQSDQESSATNQFYKVRHLPQFGELVEIDDKQDRKKLYKDYENKLKNSINDQEFRKKALDAKTVMSVPGVEIGPTYVTGRSEQYNEFRKMQKELIDNLPKPVKGVSVTETEDVNPKGEKEKNTVTATTFREVYLKKAKIENLSGNDDHNISPVLPISLTLGVYGNNFLNIGDYFTVNFLPEHWQNRVYFQILGVNHNFSISNWKTTYKTVMRPYPKTKHKQFGYTDLIPKQEVKLDPLVQEEYTKKLFPPQENQDPWEHTYYTGPLDQDRDTRQDDTPDDLPTPEPSPANVESREPIPTTIRNIVKNIKPAETVNVTSPEINLNVSVTHYDIVKDDDSKAVYKPFPENVYMGWGEEQQTYSSQQLSWHLAISETLLTDEVINWEQLNKDAVGNPKNVNSPILSEYKASKSSRAAERGSIVILPTLVGSNANPYFMNDIGKKLNIYAQSLQQSGEAYGGGMEKIITYLNKIGEQQRNRISNFINKDFTTTDLIQGFYFLYEINFKIKDTEGKPITQSFVTIDFNENEQTKGLSLSFPIIKLPRKYLKINAKALVDKLIIRMVEHLENFQKIKKGEEVNAAVGVENLGDNPPYTNVNFDIGAPDGPPGPYSAQHATAADARRALAIEYGIKDGSYNKYKAKFPGKAERDMHWLNNPQLW